MLISEHHVSWQGDRAEQLDRFQVVETGKCTLLMMADGFSDCDASPHYVDWLVGQLEKLNASGQPARSALKSARSCVQRVISRARPASRLWFQAIGNTATLPSVTLVFTGSPAGRERTIILWPNAA